MLPRKEICPGGLTLVARVALILTLICVPVIIYLFGIAAVAALWRDARARPLDGRLLFISNRDIVQSTKIIL